MLQAEDLQSKLHINKDQLNQSKLLSNMQAFLLSFTFCLK